MAWWALAVGLSNLPSHHWYSSNCNGCCNLSIDKRMMLTIRSVRSLYWFARLWCIHPCCRRWCSRLSFLWPWTEYQNEQKKHFCNKIVFIFRFWFSISCNIGFVYNHCWFVIYSNVLLNPRRSSVAFSARHLSPSLSGSCYFSLNTQEFSV